MGQGLLRKRANLRDVARASGVSVATVSRVLNTPAKVSEATRRQVQEAIDALNFMPNAAARAINSGRSRKVGALIPTLDNAIFARFLDGLENRLTEHELALIVSTTDDDPVIEAEKARVLVDIGAEGLIISGVTHSSDLEALIDRAQVPAVAISYFDGTYRWPTVGYDNGLGAAMALNHLHDLGHRHIAVLHGPPANNDRTRARLQTLQLSEFAVELSYFEAGVAIAEGAALVPRLLKDRRLTALLCLSDVLAAGALFGLQRAGRSVPEDLSVIGMEDLAGSASLYPALTTIRLPVFEMGQAAADAIAGWVERGERPAAALLPVELKIRESTKPVGL